MNRWLHRARKRLPSRSTNRIAPHHIAAQRRTFEELEPRQLLDAAAPAWLIELQSYYGSQLGGNAPPAVVEVAVRGSQWSEAFLNHLDAAGLGAAAAPHLGYRVPQGADPPQTLPWNNIDTISISFSQDVAVDAADLELYGVAIADYGQTVGLTPGGFTYDSAQHVATWQWQAPIAADRLLLRLNAGIGGVTGADGTPLDGDGDGVASGDLRFAFSVLPGDADHSGMVRSSDGLGVRTRLLATPSAANYSPFHDLDGSGAIVAADVLIARDHLLQSLPDGQPAAPLGTYQIVGSGGSDLLVINPIDASSFSYTLNGGPLVTVYGVNALQFDAGDGDDVLVVSTSLATPLLAGGIVYHGGANVTSQGDLLSIVGDGTSTANYTPSSTPDSGDVWIDGRRIQFTGLEPMDVTGQATATITLTGGNDILNITNGFDFLAGNTNPALVVSGTSGGTAFEQVAFWNNTTLLIDTTAVDGNDTVTIVSASNAHGNANIEIDTGSGADVVNVNGDMAVATGNIFIFSQNINLNANLTASAGVVVLSAGAGAIVDDGVNTTRINALGAVLVAGGNVGGAAAAQIDTNVNFLEASSNAGSVYVQNVGALVIGGLSTVNGVLAAGVASEVVIVAGGALTVTEIVGSNGSVTLVADEINLSATVQSDLVYLGPATAARAVDLGTKTVGKLGLTNAEVNLISATEIFLGNTTFANAGEIAITAPITITGALGIDLRGDSVTDNHTTTNVVTVTHLIMETAHDIGAAGAGGQIDTNVTTVTAFGSISDIYIAETAAGGDLILGVFSGFAGVGTYGNVVSVETANGTLYVNHAVLAGLGIGLGNITLTSRETAEATAANVVIAENIQGNVVKIISADDITRSAGTITATDLTLDAQGAIGASAARLATQTTTITATAGAGSVFITETDGLTLTSVTATGVGNDVDVTSATGDITVVSVAAPDRVTLTATAGSIIDDGDNATRINAAGAILAAGTTIGSAGATGQIDTNVTNLEAASGTGGVYVANTGALTVGGLSAVVGVAATGGTVQLAAGGLLTVNETVASTADILLAADDILLAAAVQAAGVATLAPLTAGRQIDLGTKTAGKLGITNAEIAQITTGVISIGSATAGQIAITDAITITGLRTLLLTTAADIVDSHVIGADLAVNGLAMQATAGIGSGDALDTAVSVLAANNTSAGDIRVDNSVGGLLIIGTPTGGGLAGITNAGSGGAIVVTNASPVTIVADVIDSGGGNIVLTSTNDGGNDDHLTISARVVASGGNGTIQLNAGTDLIVNDSGNAIDISAAGTGTITGIAARHVVLNAAVVIEAADGAVTLTADNVAGNNGGRIDMNDNALVRTAKGAINLTADGNITLGGLAVTGPDSKIVTIITTSGSILDGGDTYVDVSINVGSLSLTAAQAIGAAGAGRIDISVDALAAKLTSPTATGDIYVTEIAAGGALAIDAVGAVSGVTTTNSRSIDIETTNGSLSVNQAVAADGAGNVTLRSQETAEATVANVALAANVRGNLVVIVSADDITRTAGTAQAANLLLDAQNGIGTAAARIQTNLSGQLAARLTGAGATGDIFITETAAGGDLTIGTANGVNGVSTTNNRSIDIETTDGTLSVNQAVTANGFGNVTLTSHESVEATAANFALAANVQGNLVVIVAADDITRTAGTVQAANLLFDAQNGVGTAAARIQTEVSGQLAARITGAGATGDIFITETATGGNLTIGTANSVNGASTTNNRSINIETTNGSLSVNQAVTANGLGNVTLTSQEAAEATVANVALAANVQGNLVVIVSADDITRTAGTVQAANLLLDAQNGIGTAAARIQTNVSGQLAARLTGAGAAGDIFITETVAGGDLTIGTANGVSGASTTNNRSIDIETTDGTLSASQAVTANGLGNVTLTSHESIEATAANVALGANVQGNLVVIASADDITRSAGTVQAANLLLDAQNGVGTAAARIQTEVSGQLAARLTGAGATGDIFVTETTTGGDLTIGTANGVNGASTTNNRSIDIETTNGTLSVNQAVTANGLGNATLTSQETAEAMAANVALAANVQGNLVVIVAADDITRTAGTVQATNLLLDAQNGIGVTAARIQTNVAGQFAARLTGAAATGDIFVTEIAAGGGLTIGTANLIDGVTTTNNRSIDITATAGTLTVNKPVNAGASGNIALRGVTVALPVGSTVSTTNGVVTLEMGLGNVVGQTTYQGAIDSNNAVQVKGNTASDTLTIDLKTATLPTTPAGVAPVEYAGNAGAGIDTLELLGTEGQDVFCVSDALGTVRWNGSLNGAAIVHYVGVETLDFQTRGEDDQVTFRMDVAGSVTKIVVDGGPHSGTTNLQGDGLRIFGTDLAGTADIIKVADKAAGALPPDPAPLPVSYRRLEVRTANLEVLQVFAQNGDDYVYNDTAISSLLDGALGNDHLIGGTAADAIFGGPGIDWLEGRGGNNFLFADHAYDTSAATDAARQAIPVNPPDNGDKVVGGTGNDKIVALGTDSVSGGGGTDTFYVDFAVGLSVYDWLRGIFPPNAASDYQTAINEAFGLPATRVFKPCP